MTAGDGLTVAQLEDQLDAVLYELETLIDCDVSSGGAVLAWALGCAQAAAVTFGHYHRAMETSDAHFRQQLADVTARLIAEAHRHRTKCVLSRVMPEHLVSTLQH